MGKFILDLPENLHNELRHKSIDLKRDMKDLIIGAIQKWLKTKKK